MTKYLCHKCGKIYNDEEGMPGQCCGKTLRHKVVEGKEDYGERILEACPDCGDELDENCCNDCGVKWELTHKSQENKNE